jgi:hypothetical protein
MMQMLGNFLDKIFVKDTNSTTQVFGKFIDKPLKDEHLTLGFSPSRIPIKRRWRNNGLSADFIADYLTTFFPKEETDPSSLMRHSEIRSAVSYIANELLENAMKYCDMSVDYPITLHLQLESDEIRIFVNNSLSNLGAEKFKFFIKELESSNPDEFYIRQLEKNAEDEKNTTSGLGFLTMINDYYAKLGWKFQVHQQEPQIISVSTMVQLNV